MRGTSLPVVEPTESPVVRALCAALESSPGSRDLLVADFWAAARTGGTPVIEPAPEDPQHLIVTFLFRADLPTTRVLLVANRIGDRANRVASLLERVPDTDIWHIAYRLQSDHRASYGLVADDGRIDLPAALLQDELTALARSSAADPLAREEVAVRWSERSASVLTLPGAPVEHWRATAPDSPAGGTATVPWSAEGVTSRPVHLYRAPGDQRQPIVLLFDGDMWFGRLALERDLDAAVAAGVLPPVTVVSPSALDVDTRWTDLCPRDTFLDHVLADAPALAARLGPVQGDGLTVAGQSLGGLSGLYAAARHPDQVTAVVAQSPSLWWRPGADRRPSLSTVEDPWLCEVFRRSSAAPTRIRIDVGAHEGAMATMAHTLAETLRETDRTVEVTVYNGGHDYVSWRVHLVESLAHLLAATDTAARI